MKDKACRIPGRFSLITRQVLTRVCPTRDPFHQNPIDLLRCRSSVQSRALHLTADRFRFSFSQLIQEDLTIDEPGTSEHQSEAYHRTSPIGTTATETI